VITVPIIASESTAPAAITKGSSVVMVGMEGFAFTRKRVLIMTTDDNANSAA